MRRYLGPREGALTEGELPRVLTYLETVFNQRYSRDTVGVRTAREMRTVAEALDAILADDHLRAGDLLIQRFKALETSVVEGNWSMARHHEIIPEEGVGLATTAEKQLMTLLELQRRKLAEPRGKPAG